MNKTLLIMHLLGFALGMSVPFANIIFGGLLAMGRPEDEATYARFIPRMARLGDLGLALMWISGPVLVFTKHGGFAGLPTTFHVKLLAVVILTLGVGFIHANMRKALAGDPAARKRVDTTGKMVTFPAALVAMVFAVLTFG